MRGFKQLTAGDRVLISKLKEKKLSLSEIARRIGKNKSTFSRELRRNQTEEELDEYLETQPAEERAIKTCWTHVEAKAQSAHRRWLANQKRRRKLPETRKWVVEQLRQGWSPEQIAGRFGKPRQRLGDREYTLPPDGRRGIEERPAIVEQRSRLGDNECVSRLRWP